MEVSIVGSEGLSCDNIVMIRAGQMRRQAKLSAGTPFQFPTLPLNATPLRVEVYKQLHSKPVALSPDADRYVVRIAESAAEGIPASRLQLSVQESGLGSDAVPAGQQEEQLQSKVAGSSNADERKAEAAEKAKAYLQKHNLVDYVQDMVTAMLKQKPDDPFRYMQQYARGEQGLATACLPKLDTAPAPAGPSRTKAEPTPVRTASEPPAHADDQDSHADFGEETPALDAQVGATSPARAPEPEGLWVKESHQAWNHYGVHGFLNTYVNTRDNQLRFVILAGDVRINVAATQAEFDEIMDQQDPKLTHPQRLVKTLEALVEASLAEDAVGDDSDSAVDHFGEDSDDEDLAGTLPLARRWSKQTQQAWHHDGMHGILTSRFNSARKTQQYSLMTAKSRLTVSCTDEAFDDRVQRQSESLPPPLRIKAAIEELLREAAQGAPSKPPADVSMPVESAARSGLPGKEECQEAEALGGEAPKVEEDLQELRRQVRSRLAALVRAGTLQKLLDDFERREARAPAEQQRRSQGVGIPGGRAQPSDDAAAKAAAPTPGQFEPWPQGCGDVDFHAKAVARGDSRTSTVGSELEASHSASPGSSLVERVVHRASSASDHDQADLGTLEEPPRSSEKPGELNAADALRERFSTALVDALQSGRLEEVMRDIATARGVREKISTALGDAIESGRLDEVMRDMTTMREAERAETSERAARERIHTALHGALDSGRMEAAMQDMAKMRAEKALRERVHTLLHGALDSGRLEAVMQDVSKVRELQRAETAETALRGRIHSALIGAFDSGRMEALMQNMAKTRVEEAETVEKSIPQEARSGKRAGAGDKEAMCREMTIGTLSSAHSDGRLKTALSNSTRREREAQSGKRAGAEEDAKMYREMAIDTLSRAHSDGRLKQALNDVAQQRRDASREELREKTRAALIRGVQSGALHASLGGACKAQSGKQAGAEEDAKMYREMAIDTLSRAHADGRLKKALNDVALQRREASREELRERTRAALVRGVQSGALHASLGGACKAKREDEQLEELRGKAMCLLLRGLKTGALQASIDGAMQAPALRGRQSGALQERQDEDASIRPQPAMPPSVMEGSVDTASVRGDTDRPAVSARPPSPPKNCAPAPLASAKSCRPGSAPLGKTRRLLPEGSTEDICAEDQAEDERRCTKKNMELQATNDKLEREVSRLRGLLNGQEGSACVPAATTTSPAPPRGPTYGVPLSFRIGGLGCDRLAGDEVLVGHLESQLRAELSKRTKASESLIDVDFSRCPEVHAVIRSPDAGTAAEVLEAVSASAGPACLHRKPYQATSDALLMAVLGTRGVGSVVQGRIEVTDFQVGQDAEAAPVHAEGGQPVPNTREEGASAGPIPPPPGARPGGLPRLRCRQSADGGASADHGAGSTLEASNSGVGDELQSTNVELQARCHQLAEGLVGLQSEREQMKQLMGSMCDSMETMATEIRALVDDPQASVTPDKT